MDDIPLGYCAECRGRQPLPSGMGQDPDQRRYGAGQAKAPVPLRAEPRYLGCYVREPRPDGTGRGAEHRENLRLQFLER